MRINLWELLEKMIEDWEIKMSEEKEDDNSFYMIYVVWWNSPTKQFSLEDARKEAEILCNKENKEFFILKAIKSFTKNNVIEIDL